MLAVDAGSHLASIQRILERDFPVVSGSKHVKITAEQQKTTFNAEKTTQDLENERLSSSDSESRSPSPEVPTTILDHGPFAGLSFPCTSARANAVHVVREHVNTYLITHPHLDHISAFAINTAAFHNTSRPKRLAALPFAVNAIKTHIFNDIVWPNLTDEDNGVGLVTFQRLTEGGNLALGDGHSRGFIEVCNGLAVKGFKVSHGRCAGTPRPEYTRRGSNTVAADVNAATQHHGSHGHSHPQQHNGATPGRTPIAPNETRRASIFSQTSQPGTPTFYSGGQELAQCVVDSSAFFIRADDTGKEILVFGDVEPDSISLVPRTHIVWQEAAPKIAQGILSGIFIECSYTDSQKDNVLFGHFAPRHLVKELEGLADFVAEKRKEAAEKVGKKRKRHSGVYGGHHHASPSLGHDEAGKISRTRTSHRTASGPAALPSTDEAMRDAHVSASDDDAPTPLARAHAPELDVPPVPPLPQPALELPDGALATTVPPPEPFDGPLRGVRVVIIHVKDTMADGPLVGETVLQELWAHEARLAALGRPLGCTFEVSTTGASYWF